MSESLISIIIPVLDGSKFLVRCFDTLEKQLYSNLEVIFIDNGSEDDSKAIIKNQCSMKKNYYLIECNKPGPGAARNIGIKFAKGEYISFLDVDDEIHPEKHHLLLNALVNNPTAGIAVGNTMKKYNDGREYKINLGTMREGINLPPSPGILWLKQFQHHPHISSILIPKQIIENVGYFSEDLFYGEDISLTVKIGIEYSMIWVDKTVSTYNRHNDSAISKSNQKISPTERYFQFYEKFALPYFFNRKKDDPFKKAFIISEKIAFKMLMKLIKVEKNYYYKGVLNNLIEANQINNDKIRYIIFGLFPYKIANYLSQKLQII